MVGRRVREWGAVGGPTPRGASARLHSPAMTTPLARASIAAARTLRARGGGGGGRPFWSEGTQAGSDARLFNESPPPAGTRRKWESWEAIW